MISSEYDDLKRFVEDYEPEQENTMTEIKRCPFCGELPVVCLKNGDMHNVSCETVDCCGENDLWWETEQEAIEAWNTRNESICKRVKGGMKYGSIKWVCSECGYGLGDKRHNYCPSCGAKVIEE